MAKVRIAPKEVEINPNLKHIVDPWTVKVARDQRVKFMAVGTDAIVFIPRGNKIFEGRVPTYIVKHIKSGHHFLTPPRKGLSKGDRRTYHYAVYCVAREAFAEKTSPVMLMEPP
jgi:hypothetical protein